MRKTCNEPRNVGLQARELFYPLERDIVERDRVEPQLPSRGVLDPPPPFALPQLVGAIPSSQAATDPCSGSYRRDAISAAAKTSEAKSAASSRSRVLRSDQRTTNGRYRR